MTTQRAVQRKIEVMTDGSRRLRWGDFYPLLHVSEPLGAPRLPPPRQLVALDDLSEAPRVLVTGERGGGGGDFLRWWQAGLSARSRRWVYGRGELWGPDFFGASPGADELTKSGLRMLGDLNVGNSQKRAQRIKAWAQELSDQGETAHLLLRDLGGLGERSAEKLAGALQLACELEVTYRALRVVVVSSSEYRFADLFDATGFAARSQCYRMAWLTGDDIAFVAEKGGQVSLTIAAREVAELIELTGGQPRVVWTMLESLRAAKGQPWSPVPRELFETFRKLRASPPAVAESWRSDLARRLKQTRDLGFLLRQFVNDQNLGYDQSHAAGLLPLLHAGWVRFDDDLKQWRISSRLHRHLAQQVLAEMERV